MSWSVLRIQQKCSFITFKHTIFTTARTSYVLKNHFLSQYLHANRLIKWFGGCLKTLMLVKRNILMLSVCFRNVFLHSKQYSDQHVKKKKKIKQEIHINDFLLYFYRVHSWSILITHFFIVIKLMKSHSPNNTFQCQAFWIQNVSFVMF